MNYPTISAFDFAWIQNVRKQHDELYLQVINPHFTLVFPAFNFLEAPFINHVQQVTQKTQAFDFVIRCAVLSNDVFSQYTHVFLVPDEGYSNIVKLHDCLYTGVLTLVIPKSASV
ncbi:MAG: 2'-5' RNA ligase family protein [Nostoc sp.]|uniref:2'-5' RNA ligase family protein n=1 Tax=Nostoc sp. TaxID=1180 RepID=UPI002FF8DE60